MEDFLSDPRRLREQAERWLGQKQSIRTPAQEAQTEKLAVEQQQLRLEEERYGQAYAAASMSFETYSTLMQRLNQKRQQLECEAAALRERASASEGARCFTPDTLVSLAERTLGTLKHSDRRTILRRLVERVVADPEDLTVLGRVPLGRDGAEEGALRPARAENMDANLPFELRIKPPKPDLGKNGYSTRFLINLVNESAMFGG